MAGHYMGYETAELHPPTAPWSGPSPSLSRNDSVYSQQSSLAPDDSISVVGGAGGGGSAPRAVGQYGGQPGSDWRYEDPYADPYAGVRRQPRSAFSAGQTETIRLTPHEADAGSYNYADPFAAEASSSHLPLVDRGGRKGPFDPLEDDRLSGRRSRFNNEEDDDADTVVGSAYRTKFAGESTEDAAATLGAIPYSSLARGDNAGSPHGTFDEETKYPPPPSPDGQKRARDNDGMLTAEEWAELRSRRPPVWKRLVYDTTPLEDRIALHKRGVGVQDRPWMCWLLAVGMAAGLIAEYARNWQEQGRPISTSPTFNYMIGPSSYVLINTGARFTPCIKNVPAISSLDFPCLNVTTTTATCFQSLEQLCGFGGFPSGQPDQTFRFILPIFLHAGLIHLLLNLFVQLTSSAIVERQMGSLRFIAVFVPSGVFGFILGGNFSLVGLPSVGASGAIFGTHAAVFVDLVAHWGIEYRPGRKLLFLLIEIVVGLALGLIPGVDNFAHIGGFAMGLLLSLALLPVLHRSTRHRLVFVILRLVAVAGAIVMFVVLYRNFFTANPGAGCSWCRYLSCWPTNSNNHCQGTGLTTTTTTTTTPGTGSSLPLLLLTLTAPLWRHLGSPTAQRRRVLAL